MDENKQMKNELKEANQHLQDEGAMLRQCVGKFSLTADFLLKRS